MAWVGPDDVMQWQLRPGAVLPLRREDLRPSLKYVPRWRRTVLCSKSRVRLVVVRTYAGSIVLDSNGTNVGCGPQGAVFFPTRTAADAFIERMS